MLLRLPQVLKPCVVQGRRGEPGVLSADPAEDIQLHGDPHGADARHELPGQKWYGYTRGRGSWGGVLLLLLLPLDPLAWL